MQDQHVLYQLYILFNLLLLSVAKTLLHDSICIACLTACVIFVRVSTSLLYSKQLWGWPHVFEVLWISLMVSYGKDAVCRNTKIEFCMGSHKCPFWLKSSLTPLQPSVDLFGEFPWIVLCFFFLQGVGTGFCGVILNHYRSTIWSVLTIPSCTCFLYS